MDIGKIGPIYEFAQIGLHREMADICLMCGATQFLTYNKMANMYTLSRDYSLLAGSNELEGIDNFKALIREMQNIVAAHEGLNNPADSRNDFLITVKLDRITKAVNNLEEMFIDVYQDYSMDDISNISDNGSEI